MLAQIDKEIVQDPCWNQNEIAMAIQGFNKYGENFKATSEVIGKFIWLFYRMHFKCIIFSLILTKAAKVKTQLSLFIITTKTTLD